MEGGSFLRMRMGSLGRRLGRLASNTASGMAERAEFEEEEPMRGREEKRERESPEPMEPTEVVRGKLLDPLEPWFPASPPFPWTSTPKEDAPIDERFDLTLPI